MRILIIEDNSRVSSLLKRGLESQDYQVYISEDAEDAIVLLNKLTFDLAITDIMLPKMNGIDLCKFIKQKYPDLPVIMLTALGTIDEKVEGFDAGADDYMVKPFEIRELFVRIKAILQRSSNKNRETYLSDLEYHDLKINKKINRVFRNGRK
jgi:DNA-binding response OmpR family regulator